MNGEKLTIMFILLGGAEFVFDGEIPASLIKVGGYKHKVRLGEFLRQKIVSGIFRNRQRPELRTNATLKRK